jgi:methionyl-tRNA synthetase
VELVHRYGTDAVRWWLLREVPRVGDVDFTATRLTARANDDLANGLGNLVSRVVTLVHRYRQGKVPRQGEYPVASAPGGRALASAAGGRALASAAGGRALAAACQRAPERIAAALSAFDFRAATAAIWDVVGEANRYVEWAEPWLLARAERDGDPAAGRLLDESLALLVGACSELAIRLAPFLPDLAERIRAAVDDSAGQLPAAEPVFPRLEAASAGAAV